MFLQNGGNLLDKPSSTCYIYPTDYRGDKNVGELLGRMDIFPKFKIAFDEKHESIIFT